MDVGSVTDASDLSSQCSLPPYEAEKQQEDDSLALFLSLPFKFHKLLRKGSSSVVWIWKSVSVANASHCQI